MSVKSARIALVCTVLGVCFLCAGLSVSQERLQAPVPAAGEIPKGVEVLARGPVHEAFASPTTEPKPAPAIAKKPPAPIEELPPEEKPEGDVIWIGGYYAYDDDRADFLWVSGCWRVKPEGKEWVPGYWREVGANWQWVPGFWANAQDNRAQPITYYPEPPAPPNVAPPGQAPAADMIHVPGYWQWTGDRYVWRAGYFSRVRPGYVYVPSHYRWTPFGYVFVAGYWDYSVARRGVLYAPVAVDVVVVGPRYVYTPYYAVRDTIVLDTLFVRPAYGAYYFGDYYGPRYVAIGFEPCIVYSRRHYEPIIVYERWHHRANPRWHDTQVTLVIERNAGRAPVPPRTLVQQTTIVQKNVNVTNVTNVIAPTKTVVVARGEKVVPLSSAARTQVAQTTQASQKAVAADRRKTETAPTPPGSLSRPRTTTLNVPATPPVGAVATKNPMTIGNPPPGKGPITTTPPIGKGPITTTPPVGKGPITTTPPVGKGPIITPPVGKGPITTTPPVGKGPIITPTPPGGGTTVRPKDRPIDTKKGPDDRKKKN